MTDTASFRSLRYEAQDRKAYITLDRPERLNAIDRFMPGEIGAAVELANDDDQVHVIVLRGAGRSFCSGYDLKDFAEGGVGTQGVVWDPIKDFRAMKRNTDRFTSLFRSLKPTIIGNQQWPISCAVIQNRNLPASLTPSKIMAGYSMPSTGPATATAAGYAYGAQRREKFCTASRRYSVVRPHASAPALSTG